MEVGTYGTATLPGGANPLSQDSDTRFALFLTEMHSPR
jgi:hypothetical protein